MELENVQIGAPIKVKLIESDSTYNMVHAGTKGSNWHYFIKEQDDGKYIIEYKVGKSNISLINNFVEFSEKNMIPSTYKPKNYDYDFYEELLIKSNLWSKK